MPGWRALSANSNFVGSRVYACLGVTCHQHFWQNDPSLVRATVATWGWNGHRIGVSTQLEKKFSCCSCRESDSHPFDHENCALPTSYHYVSPTAVLKLTAATSSDSVLTGSMVTDRDAKSKEMVANCDQVVSCDRRMGISSNDEKCEE